MSPHSCSPTSENYRTISQEDVNTLIQQNAKSFEDIGLELHCFKIAWYNALVAPDYSLDYHGDTLAILVISTPSMFEKAFLPFLADVIEPSTLESNAVYFDPIDKCMQHYFGMLQQELSARTNSSVEVIHDFELQMPHRRPKILLQTAAHISGAAYYYKIQSAKQRLGVCIHPSYGGWFGIRGAFVFKQLLVPDLQQKLPPDVVSEDKQAELLRLFNDHWQEMTYRNIIPVKSRYSQLQIEYFTLKPRDRIEFIKNTIFPNLCHYKNDHDMFSSSSEPDDSS